MFDPKSIAVGALSRAPVFLLGRPSGIIDGIMVGYGTMAFFTTSGGWMSTIFSTIVCVLVALAVGKVLDTLIPLVVAAYEPSLVGAPSTQSNARREQSAIGEVLD